MFPAVEKNESFVDRELAVLEFWKQQGIYDKTLAARMDAENFVFYEGPPTANGMPHPGHCLTRAIKDLFPRYKTMRGYRCERKAGWDTHGLPVEVEVCKELGIHSKEEIEAHGIEDFIQLCQRSVWRYMQEWERLTERIGFWVNLEDAYVTYHQSYVESVWWSLKTLFDRGQLYQGHKIVWWWAQGGTALSAGEVGQGYREVADPSVFVKFPLMDGGPPSKDSLLVWTTTPWTLPSNQFVAVNPKLTYVRVEEEGDDVPAYILAKDLLGDLEKKTKKKFKVYDEFLGEKLIGLQYIPPYLEFFNQTNVEERGESVTSAWTVRAADFVTTESGTGLVHIAPAFGEEDYNILLRERERLGNGGPSLINCVSPDGKFTDEAPEFLRGRWVKDCDKDINRDLKDRNFLFHQEQYLHDYPFCWRAEEDPLIQYPRESWFIRTTEAKDQMLANNAEINWLPGHIKDGRFGKFLESNVDWALSRERYWGTPLPVWQCEATGKQEAIGSYEELLAKPQAMGVEVWETAKADNPDLPDDLRVHKPYIDAITYASPFAEGARMRRVPEVIDCWYDSGAMPFAQWGYRGEPEGVSPRSASENFHSQFPADFISEAIDQTRGWFYSQLAISTMMFSNGEGGEGRGETSHSPPSALPVPPYPHPFKNCIVLGLMLGEDGQKMSKSKRNYRDPSEIFELYGADALRWYFFANQPPWTSIRYSEQAIKDSIPEFLLRLWNVYSFFTIYANIDGFDPKDEGGRRKAESELDRWILSELNSTLAVVVERMDEYDNYGACQAITEFVDALSNWYVRRSRDRFWASDKQSPEKLDAYWTLYECLITSAKMIAPFVPFLAESLWQKLAVAVLGDSVPESVHLCDYPLANSQAIDAALSTQMNLVREITSLGRQARSGAELKVRQPLAKVEVILADATHQAWLESHAELIAEELNVKAVEFTEDAEQYIDYSIVPNFKRLGPKLGKNMPKVKKLLGEVDGGQMLAELKSAGKFALDLGDGESIDLDEQDIEVRLQAKEGWTAAQGRGVVVVLATEITEELLFEGMVNDMVRFVQDKRKDLDCDFTDRINLHFVVNSEEASETEEQIVAAFEQHRDRIVTDTLAAEFGIHPVNSEEGLRYKVQLSQRDYNPVGTTLRGHQIDVDIERLSS